MNATEVRALLTLIETYDRSTFQPKAVELWGEALRRVSFEDAEAAVHAIFRVAGHDDRGNIRKLLPIDVKRPAEAIGEARRRRRAQAAIAAPAQRVGSTGRPAAVEQALAEARAKAEAAAARYREPVAA